MAIALLIVPFVAWLVEVVVVPQIDEDLEVLSIRRYARQREYLHTAVATDAGDYDAVRVANQSLRVRRDRILVIDTDVEEYAVAHHEDLLLRLHLRDRRPIGAATKCPFAQHPMGRLAQTSLRAGARTRLGPVVARHADCTADGVGGRAPAARS